MKSITGLGEGPRQQAGVEVIILGVGDTELQGLVEKSRPGDAAPGAGVLVLSPRGQARWALQQLTGRELEVLALMAEGRSNQAIASHLFVTEHTIEKHIKNIFAALRLSQSRADHRRVLAVLTYLTAAATC
jgi:DNA-binding NarL/FixJ family response regulator